MPFSALLFIEGVQEIKASRFVLWRHIFYPVWSSWICLTSDLLLLKFGFSCMWSDYSDSDKSFTLGLSVHTFFSSYFVNFVCVCVHAWGNLCPIRKQTHRHSPAPVTTGCFPPSQTSTSFSVCSPVRKKPLVLSRWIYFSPVYSSFTLVCCETCIPHSTYWNTCCMFTGHCQINPICKHSFILDFFASKLFISNL